MKKKHSANSLFSILNIEYNRYIPKSVTPKSEKYTFTKTEAPKTAPFYFVIWSS